MEHKAFFAGNRPSFSETTHLIEFSSIFSNAFPNKILRQKTVNQMENVNVCCVIFTGAMPMDLVK